MRVPTVLLSITSLIRKSRAMRFSQLIDIEEDSTLASEHLCVIISELSLWESRVLTISNTCILS